MRLESAVSLDFSPSALPTGAASELISVDTRFGRLALDADRLLTMPVGLLGFAELTRFGLARMPGDRFPNFMLLQPATRGDVTFVVAPAESVGSPIAVADVADTYRMLNIAAEDGLTLLVVSPRNGDQGFQMTVNCRAPIFVDTRRRLAWQIVLSDPSYSIRQDI